MAHLTPATTTSGPAPDRIAPWLRLPRRILFLFVAFALVWLLILGLRTVLGATLPGPVDWSRSVVTDEPVVEILGERSPSTFVLVALALVLAAGLAGLMGVVAVGVERLRARNSAAGSFLASLGRLAAFSLATAPVFVLGILVLYWLAIRLSVLPMIGVGPGGLGPTIGRLVLPALLLALFPAVVAAQVGTSAAVLPTPDRGGRRGLSGLLLGLAALLEQVGGLLSAAVLLEVLFARPGVGRLMLDAIVQRDVPVALGVLLLLTVLVLLGRLAAAVLAGVAHWLAPGLAQRFPASGLPRAGGRVWLAVAALLLLVPVGVFIAGLATNPEAALETNLGDISRPPSAEHPWGTDMLGRDIQARVLRGAVTSLGLAAAAAVLVWLPGTLFGAITAWLAGRRQWWSESLAELLLLPVDVLLLLPAVPAAALVVLLTRPSASVLLVAVVLVLLPRAVRAAHAAWLGLPSPGRGGRLTAGLAALWLLATFAALSLVAALNFLGLGVPPPVPTLGGMVAEGLRALALQPWGALAAGAVLWFVLFALYTAAAAALQWLAHRTAAAWINA